MKRETVAGIDVSASELVVAVSGSERVVETFPNDADGHARLLKFLRRKRCVRVVAEATGIYGLDMLLALDDGGIAVMQANPRAVKAFLKALLKRAKTDRVDALGLCDFAERMPFVPWTRPSAAALELRALTRRMTDLTKLLTAEKNRRHAAAATSTTPAFVRDSIDRQVASLETELELVMKHALHVAKADAELQEKFQLLLSVPGIGPTTAVKLLSELIAMPSDLTVRQLVAMAGLDPRPIESGTYRGQRRISRAGSGRLRAMLFMSALAAIRHPGVVRSFYDELIARGKQHMKAMVAVMRKLLHAAWGVLHTRTAFRRELFRRQPNSRSVAISA